MMPEAAQQGGHAKQLATLVTTPWAAARSSGMLLATERPAGPVEKQLDPRLAAAAAMPVSGRLQVLEVQAAQGAEEQQAGPVGPTALSCPQRTGPSPAAQAAAVGFGPYWVQTAQEGSAHRCAPDPSGQLIGILNPNTTPYARPRPTSRRPWAGDFPGPPLT